MNNLKRARMTSTPDFDRFLYEAIASDREAGAGLGPDSLYGLYTSWCMLSRSPIASPEALFRALKERHGINPLSNRLAMTGLAATDYILASAPGLV